MNWTKVSLNPRNKRQILFPNNESMDFYMEMVQVMPCRIGLVIEDIRGNILMLKGDELRDVRFVILQSS